MRCTTRERRRRSARSNPIGGRGLPRSVSLGRPPLALGHAVPPWVAGVDAMAAPYRRGATLPGSCRVGQLQGPRRCGSSRASGSIPAAVVAPGAWPGWPIPAGEATPEGVDPGNGLPAICPNKSITAARRRWPARL